MRISRAQELTNRMKVVSDRAVKFMQSQGYEFKQHNGQRWSTLSSVRNPPSDNSATEVFVGHLPRDMFEDELFPFFNRVGVIYKIRLMMDFSGSNRGFGFIKFMNVADAQRAVEYLNEKVIRPSEPPIGVVASFNNRRLFFSKLPAGCTYDQLLIELRKKLDAVEDVEIISSSGYSMSAKVTFVNHEAATQARRVLIPGGVKILGADVIVDWAKREDGKPNNHTSSMRKPSSSFSSSTATKSSELHELNEDTNYIDNTISTDIVRDLNNNLSAIYPNSYSPPILSDIGTVPYNFNINENFHQKYLLNDQLAMSPPPSWLKFFDCVNGIFNQNSSSRQNSFNQFH